jgi:Root hair defective 3 GTP-binding protein (RHD3)
MQVKYAAMPNFEEREEDFRAESVLLRRRFTDEGAPLLSLHVRLLCRGVTQPPRRCSIRVPQCHLICAADEGQSLVRPAEDKLPGHALPLSMQRLWQVIREQKDLNLPAHKVSSRLVHSAAVVQ